MKWKSAVEYNSKEKELDTWSGARFYKSTFSLIMLWRKFYTVDENCIFFLSHNDNDNRFKKYEIHVYFKINLKVKFKSKQKTQWSGALMRRIDYFNIIL